MVRYLFSGDHHFGHEKILGYCNRPFKSLYHMNTELIKRWNERVSEEDIVLYLGDFCFSRRSKDVNYYKNQLNGNIIFVQGSHDKRSKIKSIMHSCQIVIGGIGFHCSHEPEAKFAYNLCAHVHEKWKTKRMGRRLLINVGVDQWDFYPISIEQIKRVIGRRI